MQQRCTASRNRSFSLINQRVEGAVKISTLAVQMSRRTRYRPSRSSVNVSVSANNHCVAYQCILPAATTTIIMPSPSSSWQQTQTDVYQRRCTGQEHSASYNQNIADGHTELSLALTFVTSLSTEQLTRRIRSAWLASRVCHPEVAIELSTGAERPQVMTYRVLHPHSAELDAWLASTLHVCHDASHDDVLRMTYSRRLPTRGKQSMMYFVPSSSSAGAPHALVWNVAHAITDAFSLIAFLNDFMKLILHDTEAAPYRPYDALQHLPASLVRVYEQRFQPTQADTDESVATARSQVTLYAEKLDRSIAMLPRADSADRAHRTDCLSDVLSLADSASIMAALQRQRVSITFAGAAATILAVRDMYARGGEQGALLGMTRNARRWLDTTGANSQATIPMATDVVYLWIAIEGGDDDVLSLARRIRTELAPHLRSPHYMASMQLMCDEYVDGLAASAAPTTTVAPSPPGFSPQGRLPLLCHLTSDDGKHTLERKSLRHAGRQVNASPWIGLFSLDERLHISLGFDEKYYDGESMRAFFARYRHHLRSVAATATETQSSAASRL